MGRIIVELTNRCNLRCQHCFSGRHGGHTDLPLALLSRVLAQARDYGFDYVGFTGGEPTIHPHFVDALGMAAAAGYRFGFNTNGSTFTRIYPHLLPYTGRLDVVTFSLDGAIEATHDRLRGSGSFRRVLQAVSVCVVTELPFTFNMVVTARNRGEIAAMVALATRLGSRGVRFGHIMPTPSSAAEGLDLSPEARRAVEAEIAELRYQALIPVAMAPGAYTTDLFPCTPLQMQEVNINCSGELTKCCHLSGHGGEVANDDVAGDLAEMSFGDAYARLLVDNEQLRNHKRQRLASGRLLATDYFPCWYCSLYYHKVDWIMRDRAHSWAAYGWQPVDADVLTEEPQPHADTGEQSCTTG